MLMRPGRDDRGAAAVEFALVMPVLFMLLTGIVNYGLWFNDSIQLRQGIREAARQAVVLAQFSGTTCSTKTGMDNVACGAKSQTVTTGGTAALRILTPGGWVRGNQVVVCAMVKATNFTGFVPLPADGVIRSKTSMSIESVTPAPSPTSYTADASPTGDWTWCTA